MALKKSIFLFCLMGMFLSPYIWAEKLGCFETHIKEAIEINQIRKDLYSKATNGESLRISQKLILFEKGIILPAKIFDRLATKYQKKGLPIICDGMISMTETPSFVGKQDPPKIPYSKVPKVRSLSLFWKIIQSYKKSRLDGVITYLLPILHQLEKNPYYNCMVRHFVESILRSSYLGKKFQVQAKKKKIKSPHRLNWNFIRIQALGLPMAARLDRMAAKIQEKGVPILCRDVPTIPLK